MEIWPHVIGSDARVPNWLAIRLAFSLRGMLALLLATVIAGALLVCSTIVQSNIQTFIGPNGTEYAALQWATQVGRLCDREGICRSEPPPNSLLQNLRFLRGL